MALNSLRRRVEDLERARRPVGRPVVAELPDGTRYLLVGPTITIPPRRKGRPDPGFHARRPGAWRRVRPGDVIDDAKIYYVNTLACFARLLPRAGGGPQRLTIDPAGLTEKQRAVPRARSRD